MKKNIFLLFIAFAFFVILPINVNAENAIDDVTMTVKDIVIEGVPETSISISSPHLQNMKINITWYQSIDGENYTLMDVKDTFDYNVYYKIVFDKTFDQISESMDDGWECGNIFLEIYDDQGVVDTKIFNSGTNTLEYIYEPIWKYKITYTVDGLTYEGVTEVLEGNYFSAQLIPKKKYRLPNEFEVKWESKLMISSNGHNVNYSYDYNTGYISILPEDMIGDIQIVAYGVEKEELIFDDNNDKLFILDDNQESLELIIFIEYNENFNKVYINDNELDSDNYEIDQEHGTIKLNKEYLETLNVGEYILRVESDSSYAETVFKIDSKEEQFYKVIFYGNDGIFAKYGDIFEISKWDINSYDTLIYPTREGYTFKGYYTEATGGTKLELILAESGIDSNMVFYAQWEENVGSGQGSSIVENPKTFDSIGTSILMAFISLIGLIGGAIYLKKEIKLKN